MSSFTREEVARLTQQKRMQECLPHLYGVKFYPWQRDFWTSTNRQTFLTAANQIGKSRIGIGKCIHWATNKRLWKPLWPHKIVNQYIKPTFWYLYPDRKLATIEFNEKWITEVLPRDEYKDHEMYGWKAEFKRNEIEAVHFNSGASIYFKTYSQNASSLQAGTVYGIFCFTAGHKIITDRGLLNVEDIRVNDNTLTRDGWRRVRTTIHQEREVFKFRFSNGEILEGTREHPILTDSGWKELGQLTPEDVCYTVPAWKLLKKLYYLMEVFTPDTLNTKTPGSETTLGMKLHSLYTSIFGDNTIEKMCLKITSYIIRILILWITQLRTWSVCPEASTPESTKLKNGRKLRPTHLRALSVGQTLYLDLLNGTSLDTVLKNAGKKPTTDVKKVYNLTIEDCPEYFCNGILTHNCDEELPVDLYDEIQMRLSNTEGYYHMMFTATLNQDLWRDTMEMQGKDEERFPNAKKIQVSLYDCMKYEDGQQSFWTKERIAQRIEMCSNDNEVQRRIYGRFVADTNKMYPEYGSKNIVEPFKYADKEDWTFYAGVDIGSGGKGGHPSSIVFIAVNSDYDTGYVVGGWRGDGPNRTTAGDVLRKFQELEIYYDLKGKIADKWYDHSSRDFKTIADRADIIFNPAEKYRDAGHQMLNALFKAGSLLIFDLPELQDLMKEFRNLMKHTPKEKAKDDFIDGTRYGTVSIPWNWEKIKLKASAPPEEKLLTEEEQRRNMFLARPDWEATSDIMGEISEWNDLLE